MDALSEIISFLKPKTVLTGVTEGHSPWAISFSGYDYVKFGFVSEGQCWLSFKNKKDILLEEGDAWILIKPLDFRLGSEITGPSIRSSDLFKAERSRHPVGKKTSKSVKTVIFGGGLFFDHLNSDFVLDNLPRVIVLKKERVSSTLKSIMSVLQDEISNLGHGQ